MFFDTRCNGKYVRIEYDVLWRKADFVDQYVVRSLTDTRLASKRISLTFFIKSHNDNRRAMFQAYTCLLFKFLFTRLEAD